MNTKKKIGYSVMALLTLAMGIQFLLSSLDTPSKSKTQEALALKRQAWEQQQVQTQMPQPLIDTQQEIKPLSSSKKAPQAQETHDFELTKDAQHILNSLQQAYASDINTRELNAKIEEKKASQAYDLIAHPPKTQSKPTQKKVMSSSSNRPSMASAITIKSIFKRDTRVVAWVELEGQLIPIKKGARLNHLVVEDITKNAVIFNDNGKRLTRYMAKPSIKNPDNKQGEENGIN